MEDQPMSAETSSLPEAAPVIPTATLPAASINPP